MMRCALWLRGDPGTPPFSIIRRLEFMASRTPSQDSALPQAFPAWGSTGTASWGWAISDAAQKLLTRLRDEFGGVVPAAGLEADGAFNGNPEAQQFSMHAFGARQ